ncbi:MAG: Gfo/Idh/MocA family oxidoreductase [Bryobacteraceae bacterium]|nr:Gfo/Idh/MocA family oxidoreductase [Bryobacteraceae bacterium]
MSRIALLAIAAALPQVMPAQQPTIAIIGLRHSHVWGHIGKMIKGEPARLVGIAETLPDMIAEAKKRGAPDSVFYDDPARMLDATRPTIVWAFNENSRHLEVIKLCAPRKIHVIFEKPLAATLRDAQEIRRLALNHGIHVMTNYQMAWWGANYTAKQTADSGPLGKVFRLRGIVGHGGPGGATGLNKHFFAWLTDPEKNGAGALMDFGCYNALWSLWYLGRPEKVYAQVNQLRPEEFPKVEDHSAMILSYKDGMGIFEGSWDLPRGFQDLEIFGREASLYMVNGRVEMRKGRQPAGEVGIAPLPPERSEPIAYMVHSIRNKRAPEGLVAIDINVDVVEIIDAARRSIAEGKPVTLAR